MVKLLIIDDELPIRRMLVSLAGELNDECEVIGCACNGQEALEMAQKYQPGLILADIRMPVMDGLEFVRNFKALDQNGIVVMLSNYDDFQYARSAFAYGASDYILKTEISKSKLQELLRSADVRIRESSASQSQWFSKSICFSKLYQDNTLTASDVKRLLRDNQIHFSESCFSAAAFSVPPQTFDLFEKVEQVVREAESIENPYCFAADAATMVLLFNIKSANSFLYQNHLLLAFARSLNARTGLPLGISRPEFDFKRLNACINNCITALNRHFYARPGNSPLYFYQETSNETKKAMKELLALRNQLIQAITDKESAQVTLLLEQLVEDAAKYKICDLDAVHTLFFNVAHAFLLSEDHSTPLSFAQKSEELLQEFNQCVHYSDLTAFLHRMEESYRRRLHTAAVYSPQVRNIINYIEQNYHTMETLQEIAEQMNFNIDYLYRMFKKETGITLNSYLTQVRLSKARDLLQTTNDTVYEIASKVGYSNVSYFSKKFRQMYGENPNIYRNR